MAIDANYTANLEDERFSQVDKGISKSETDLVNTYGSIVENTDKYYNDLANNAQNWADKQTQLQQEKTDFAIEQIEQQKDQAKKDYIKEQSGAYQDWQKQSNKYGVNAEKMAAAGLDKSGFSESSQVSMYNTYQNRVATARESFNLAVLNYNNAIKDAQIQNNAALAEIAYNALQTQLELSLQGFQYKNQLVLELANKKIELDNTKWQRYQDILQQINTENALKAEIDMHNDTQKWQTDQAELDREHDKAMADIEHQNQLKRDKINNEFTAKENELDRKHAEKMESIKDANERKRAEEDHKRALEILEKEKQNKLAELDKELANDKALLSYQKSLSSSPIGGSSKVTSVAKSAGQVGLNAITGSYEVNTAYYQGSKNKDCANGTFSNGYQPNNVNGSKLKKTGDTITFNTQTLYGQKQTVTQNIWKDEKGNKWYWDGTKNKYIKVPKSSK